MIIFFIVLMSIFAGQLFAAPLETGFALAPKASASQAEKDAAYREARSLLLTAAAQYERTPYRYGGMSKKGLDCSGFVSLSFHDALGISVPRSTDGLYSWVERIPIDKAQPGDLLFFKTTGNKISHVGILTGEKRFIHSASSGPKTGVIYSRLDEKYWSRTYAGAGRALPATGVYSGVDEGSALGDNALAENPQKDIELKFPAGKQRENTKEKNIMIGFAAAPTLNINFTGGVFVRGAAGQIHIGTIVHPFGQQMIIGAEIRPEWDIALGVFRLPLTLSWGLSEKLRIFAGPVLSIGDTALDASGGTNWLGVAGLSFAPFAVKIASTDIAPYAEIAWRSYFNNRPDRDIGADLAAGFHFSTGLRITQIINIK